MRRLPSKFHYPVSRRRILEAIAADYTSGMTLRQIAVKYDVSYGAARNWVITAGVPLRPKGGNQRKDNREPELRTESQ